MGLLFSPREIADIGIKIEQNGRTFYQELAARADEKVKHLFEHLMNEEKKHEEKFRQLRGELPDSDPGFEAMDDEYQAYFKTLTDSHVFSADKDPAKLAREADNWLDACQIAMEFEKDSILLFKEMKDLMSRQEHKDIVDRLIAEERKHMVNISDIMDQLSCPGHHG